MSPDIFNLYSEIILRQVQNIAGVKLEAKTSISAMPTTLFLIAETEQGLHATDEASSRKDLKLKVKKKRKR